MGRARLTPYVLLAVLMLGSGLGIWLGLTEAPVVTAWRAAFCKPVARVISRDVEVFLPTSTGQLNTSERGSVLHLIVDARLAEAEAPTGGLRSELHRYIAMLTAARTYDALLRAIDYFDVRASTQLSRCGVTVLQEKRFSGVS